MQIKKLLSAIWANARSSVAFYLLLTDVSGVLSLSIPQCGQILRSPRLLWGPSAKPEASIPVGNANIPIPKRAIIAPKIFPIEVIG